MHPSKTNYRVEFHTTPEGRPEIYDFLWEHLPKVVEELKAKNVSIQIERNEPFKNWGYSLHYAPNELEHLVHKMMKDKRFNYHAKITGKNKKTKIEIKVPAKELDHVLNAYNILFELLMNDMHIKGDGFAIDFDPSHQNSIHVMLSKKLEDKFEQAIEKAFRQKPAIKILSPSKKRKVKK